MSYNNINITTLKSCQTWLPCTLLLYLLGIADEGLCTLARRWLQSRSRKGMHSFFACCLVSWLEASGVEAVKAGAVRRRKGNLLVDSGACCRCLESEWPPESSSYHYFSCSKHHSATNTTQALAKKNENNKRKGQNNLEELRNIEGNRTV